MTQQVKFLTASFILGMDGYFARGISFSGREKKLLKRINLPDENSMPKGKANSLENLSK